jgi:hypothetical protein
MHPDEHEAHRRELKKYVRETGRCPEGGGIIKLRPEADVPEGRLACGFQCDCFGFDPNTPLEDQV